MRQRYSVIWLWNGNMWFCRYIIIAYTIYVLLFWLKWMGTPPYFTLITTKIFSTLHICNCDTHNQKVTQRRCDRLLCWFGSLRMICDDLLDYHTENCNPPEKNYYILYHNDSPPKHQKWQSKAKDISCIRTVVGKYTIL